MNCIVELSTLVVFTGDIMWSYLGGQGTNLGVASIVPPKPDDGGCGILCPFICASRVLWQYRPIF